MPQPSRTTCPTCSAPLAWEVLGGMRLYRGNVYRARCAKCGDVEIPVKGKR